MGQLKQGAMLLKVQTDDDAALAYRRWPALKNLQLNIGDEMWRYEPVAPLMPQTFAVLRDGKEIFGCTMKEAESNTK